MSFFMTSWNSFQCKMFIVLNFRSYKFKSIYYASMNDTWNNPANNYLLKVKNRNITKTWENKVKVENKDTRTMSLASFSCLYCLILNIFHTFFSASVVEFWAGKFLLGNRSSAMAKVTLLLLSFMKQLYTAGLPTSCSEKLTKWTGEHL